MNLKSSVYPAVIIVSLLGLVGLVLLGLQFTVSIEPIEPDSSLPETVPPFQARSPADKLFSTPLPKPTQQLKQNTPQVSNPQQAIVAKGLGALRMSNQTDQPVRVALLTRAAPSSADGKPNYGEPAHWDFAPGEGSRQGLILSLPDGNLKLKNGDILVAFAQDGSRRYWGPYVVGEMSTPIWNSKTSEWQLILK